MSRARDMIDMLVARGVGTVSETDGVPTGAADGILKEIRDEWAYGGADLRDLMATCAGAMVGVACA